MDITLWWFFNKDEVVATVRCSVCGVHYIVSYTVMYSVLLLEDYTYILYWCAIHTVPAATMRTSSHHFMSRPLKEGHNH